MAITQADYCAKVCKAKCCRIWKHGTQCPHLQSDCKCSIYRERFAAEQPDQMSVAVIGVDGRLMKVLCERVEKLIERNALPEWIKKTCSYAHPELLEEY